MRPLTWSSLAALMVSVLVTSGCTTMSRGTMQRVTLVTDPPGASCTLSTQGEDASNGIAATPGTVEVRRSGKPLLVNCAKSDRLDVLEPFPNMGGEYDGLFAQQVQFVGSGVWTLGVTGGVDAIPLSSDAQRAARGILGVGTVLLWSLPVVGPIAWLSSTAVDAATGAYRGYPPGIAVLLPPAMFSDAGMRDAYFRGLEEAVDANGSGRRRVIEADCRPKLSSCTEYLRELDDQIAEQHKRIAQLRERTRIAATTPPAGAPAP